MQSIRLSFILSLHGWSKMFFPINVSIASPLAGTDLLLCSLFGGLINWNSQWIFSSIWRSDGWNWSFSSYLFLSSLGFRLVLLLWFTMWSYIPSVASACKAGSFHYILLWLIWQRSKRSTLSSKDLTVQNVQSSWQIRQMIFVMLYQKIPDRYDKTCCTWWLFWWG